MSDSIRGDFFVEIATCGLGRQPKDLRVLDLGCLEGAIAIQFAKAGSRVDGVDIRPASIAKATVVRDLLDLKQLRFHIGDVINLANIQTLESSYDVIICAGLLYHLDAAVQLPFLKDLQHRCDALTIFDTHFAIDAPDDYLCHEGLMFRGKIMHELSPHSSSDSTNALWAGWKNKESFWLSESSLVNAIYLAGFRLVARVGQPSFEWPWKDRGTWIAYSRGDSEGHVQARLLKEPDSREVAHPSVRAGYNIQVRPTPDA